MRLPILIIAIAVGFFTQLGASAAADLVHQVPLTSPAYSQLRLLQSAGLLVGNSQLLTTPERQRPLTYYDFAFMLVEPLQRFVALVEAQDHPTLVTPEQRRRYDLTVRMAARLSDHDFDALISASGGLLAEFRDAVEELSPGLARPAGTALSKLRQNEYRPWNAATRPDTHYVHISVDPLAVPDPMASPLPLLPAILGTNSLAFRGGSGGEEPVIGSKPLRSLEAAVDVGIGGIRLYGTVATLPGQSGPLLLGPDGTGRAKLGLQFSLARLSDLGISGIIEYYVVRSGDPGNTNVSTGAGGGLGFTW
jgi:hypothetical protein